MAPPLRLTLTDYLDATRWRWVLSDSRGKFLADHTVQLDPASREYGGFLDLSGYLDYHQRLYPPATQLADLGKWIGAQVFGGLRDALWQKRAAPAVAVQVILPDVAHELLTRPFELARFADGRPFMEAGVRFVYQLEGTPAQAEAKEPAEQSLRILAVFSLPVRANPLNLRRERYGLQRLVRELTQTQSLAVELRVLQYGATRATLQDALEEGAGWDIIHLSGHGDQGELLLEDDRGGSDSIDADELGDLLDPARARLKLLILDACYSGAGSHAAARVQVGLDQESLRQEGAEGAAVAETTPTALPSLAQALSQRLDCATLAMRYPVGDAFATELLLALYDRLLDKRRPLPAALQLALVHSLNADIPKPPLSPATPILVGPRAADLQLVPPPQPPQGFTLPTVGLSIAFQPEPARFVGRLQPMLRASQALAPRSPMRGVLFYGMPGAGKTSCALELAYRHENGRFQGYVWYRAPEEGSDIATALFNLMQDIQTQLNAPQLGLTAALDDPAHFRSYTLPRLGALLQQNGLLLVLDNLETLLTDSNHWRVPLWGEVIATLLAHNGPSRVVLTSRRQPADLANNPRVQVEAIHALSFAESVLLARELSNLKRLFDDAEGLRLLRETLRVAQGLPKLLELADSLATDRAALGQHVAAAANELADRADVLDAFFAIGVPREGETRQSDADFVRTLKGWTSGVTSTLPSTTQLLFAVLCRLEPEDRRQDILKANWKDVLTRLGEEHAAAVAALAEPEEGSPSALAGLEAAGLVAADRPSPAQIEEWRALLDEQAGKGGLDPGALPEVLAALEAQATTYTIHPGVAEAARAATEPAVLDAADIELGNYHIAMIQQGLKREMEGRGGMVSESARRAAPYLLRRERWGEAYTLLQEMLVRDSSSATLAFALPLLRRIADATAGSDLGLWSTGVLARALRHIGRTAEAEQAMREIVARCLDQGNYRVASTAAGDLLNLLMSSGRLAEALRVAEEMAGYTRHAGLGPWTQLGDETRRLQVLVAMGRYDEVLETVEALRPQLQTLPLAGEAEEAVNPWNVRETLLHTGYTAALRNSHWEMGLKLNADLVALKQVRGASSLEIARARFPDYAPLLRLNRYDDARALLRACRAVFEAERDIQLLGMIYGALADLEDTTSGRVEAVRFQEVGMAYIYQAGRPEDCATSHNNLANYLERQGADPATILAHHLAAAVIRLQTQSGQLPTSVYNLARSDLPPSPPAFTAVAACVETVAGVRFRDLFERLPRTAPDGDAALAIVWQLVAEERKRRDEERQRRAAMLASLPAAVQAAFELEGDEFGTALHAALAELPAEEATAIMEQLREAGLIRSAPGPDMEQVLRQFEPLLQHIAAAAADESLRAEIEPELADLEEKGWMLRQPVQHLWAGERDTELLTAGLDEQDSALVRQLLKLMDQ